jgi:hypothetical protein
MYFYIWLFGLVCNAFNLGAEMNNKSRPKMMAISAVLVVVLFCAAIADR